jgi:hypothetical protein
VTVPPDETPEVDPIPELLVPLRETPPPTSIDGLAAISRRRRRRRNVTGAVTALVLASAVVAAFATVGTGAPSSSGRVVAGTSPSSLSPSTTGATDATDAPTSTSGSGAPSHTEVPTTTGPEEHEPTRSVALSIEGIPWDNATWYTDPGATTRTLVLRTTLQGLTVADCTMVQTTIFDDESIPTRTRTLEVRTQLEVVAEDGFHTFTVTCGSGVSATRTVRVADQRPERCAGFNFSETAPTATSRADLETKIVGTWKGCVTTPWLPTYEITIVFNADGTYVTTSTETLDGVQPLALYFGIDGADPQKRYAITGFDADGIGTGSIAFVRALGDPAYTDELTDIKLMGDKLSFQFLDMGQYGPVKAQLYRQ